MQQQHCLVTSIAVAFVCLASCYAGAHAGTLDRQFLDFLWGVRFGLTENQTLTGIKFETALSDLRIGGHFNATSGCGAATWNGTVAVGSLGAGATVDACLTSDALAGAYGLNLSLGLTKANFSTIAVAMVQQQLSGRCVAVSEPDARLNGTGEVKGTKWAYIYGTISVAVISILSCAGCVLIACYRMRFFPHLMLFLVELAIGSLVGEALLHLLPTVVHGGHEHEGAGMPDNFLKLVAAAATVCVLHAIDTGSTVGGLEGHSHDAAQPQVPLEVASGHSYAVSMVDGEPEAAAAAAVSVADEKAQAADGATPQFGLVHRRVRLLELARRPKLCLRNPVRLCLFIMLSDALHNFADGVAIGAAFALGNSDGLRLSLSIGLHELAHELADFAVLLSCGFSVRAAALVNFLCTFTSFGGLYIAIPLSEASAEVNVWILSVTAAMFLYISLVTMTNLVRRSYKPRNSASFFIGNLGLIAGFLSVIAISLYEFYG